MTRAVGADLLLRLGVDATGVEAEIASKLSGAERAAVISGDRISAGVSRGANKATAAQLRVVSATERYTTVLRREGATQGQIASAQATLITARRSAAKELERETVATTRLGAARKHLSEPGHALIGGVLGGTGFFALEEGFRRSVDEVKEFEKGQAQTAAALKSTGGQAHVTAEDVDKLATRVQSYSGFSEHAVVSSENLLLGFTRVRNELGKGNDVFNRATTALADLQARGVVPMEQGSKLLGRALNDPLRGLGGLTRAGVQFTTSQQLTIKALAKSGDLLGAQKLILGSVEQRVGGAAKAYGQTFAGQIDRAGRSLADFERKGLAPVLKGALDFVDFFAEHKTAREVALFAGGTVAALALVNKSVKFYGEISTNVLRRNTLTAESNLVVAGSYDRVAVAAERAAVAESGGGFLGGKGSSRRRVLGAGALLAVGAAGIAAQGSGNSVASGIGTVATDAATGAFLGQAGGPVGSAVGAAVGGVIGLGSLIFGRDDKDGVKTTRSVAQVARDLKTVTAQVNRAPDRVQIPGLIQKQGRLREELKSAREQAALTTPVLDTLTGKVRNLTVAQVAAAGAAKQHRDALAAASQQFARDPFGVDPGKQTISDAQRALSEAIRARDEASTPRTVTSHRRIPGHAGATATDLRIAELRIQGARTGLIRSRGSSNAQATLLAAEQHLNTLRSKGKTTAEQTVTAEHHIAREIGSQRAAQQRVNEARKALDTARGISAPEALRRLRANVKAEATIGTDLRTLIRKGASKEALAAFSDLDKASPNTLHRIATTASARYVRDFTKGVSDLSKKTQAAGALFLGSADFAAIQGRKDALAYKKAFAEALAQNAEDAASILAFKQHQFTPDSGGVRTLPNKVRAQGFPVP